jgi:hypothetical protein
MRRLRLGDIDVPGLERSEPQMVDPDFDTEIEREFADILDREIASADSIRLASVRCLPQPGWGLGAGG